VALAFSPLASPTTHERLGAIRAALASARESWGERGEATLETGQSYLVGEPTQIFIRKRDAAMTLTTAEEQCNWPVSRVGGSR
jgi:hypothetical protein